MHVWSDGHSFCFTPGCGHAVKAKGNTGYVFPVSQELMGIPQRGIGAIACKYYKVTCSKRDLRYGVEPNFYYVPSVVVHYPYFDREMNPLYTKYRANGWTKTDPERKIWTDAKGFKPSYFGTNFRPSEDTVILCEGESDSLFVAQTLNFKYTVLGVPGSDTLLECHKSNPGFLDRAKKIIIVLQADTTALRILADLQTIVPGHHIYKCQLTKDACDEPNLATMLYSAKPVEESPILTGDSLFKEVEQYMLLSGGSGAGLKIGLGLDSLISGWHPNAITLLAAQTKSGKTTLACQLAYMFAREHGNVLFLSLEMSVAETALTFVQIVNDCRLLGVDRVIDVTAFKPTLVGLGERVKILRHAGFIKPIELENVVSEAVKAFNVKFLVIDHLTIAATDRALGHDNKTIDVLCMTLKGVVNKYNLPCLAVTQVNEVRSEWLSAHDIKGSSVQKQIASNVIALKRFDDSMRSVVYSLTPDRFSGKMGQVNLVFGQGRFYAER